MRVRVRVHIVCMCGHVRECMCTCVWVVRECMCTCVLVGASGQVLEAYGGLAKACAGVLATLKLQFAKVL